MADPATTDQRQAAVALALRSATATVLCLFVVTWLHLEQGYLSVVTAHIINLQYAQTPFQKGIERIVGRLGGVFGITLLFLLFRHAPLLCLTLAAVVLTLLFYVQSAGWWTYGVIMATVFSMNSLAIGLTSPAGALVHLLWPTVFQLLLGVAAAEVVNFLTGFEKTIQVQSAGAPLFPVRLAWVSRGLRMTATAFASVGFALFFHLPVNTTAVAAVMLSLAPDTNALGLKGLLRIAAVLLGSAYAAVVLVILTKVPSLGLLAVFLFLGMFLGTYLSRSTPSLSYLGFQIGIVLGQVLIVPANEIVDLHMRFLRLLGAFLGFGVAFILLELWPGAATPVTKHS